MPPPVGSPWSQWIVCSDACLCLEQPLLHLLSLCSCYTVMNCGIFTRISRFWSGGHCRWEATHIPPSQNFNLTQGKRRKAWDRNLSPKKRCILVRIGEGTPANNHGERFGQTLVLANGSNNHNDSNANNCHIVQHISCKDLWPKGQKDPWDLLL